MKLNVKSLIKNMNMLERQRVYNLLYTKRKNKINIPENIKIKDINDNEYESLKEEREIIYRGKKIKYQHIIQIFKKIK